MTLGNGEDQASRRLAALLAGRDLNRLTACQRAIVAAKLVDRKAGHPKKGQLDQTISSQMAADLVGLSVTLVREARRFIAARKPAEVARVEAGIVTMHAIDKGYETETKSVLERGRNPERIEQIRLKAAIWQALKTGLIELAGLPDPRDVARIARAHDRSDTVNRHLLAVHAFLGELIDVWTTPD